MRKVTGFGQDRVSDAIEELEEMQVIRVDRSRKPSRYYVRPESEWRVEAYSATSKLFLKQEHDGPDTGTRLVPNQERINTKRLRLTDSEEAGRVVRNPTTTEAVSRIPNGNGNESQTRFDLATNDPAAQHETRMFLMQLREALKSKEFISRPPALVEDFVTRCGPSLVPLDYLLDQIIHPELYGPKGDGFFVKLQSSITRAFEAGQIAHQIANENPAQREARIALATQRKLQRRANEGAIEQDPKNHQDTQGEDRGKP